jgi:hypothetical protein
MNNPSTKRTRHAASHGLRTSLLLLLLVFAAAPAGAQVVISEFLASNHELQDQDGDTSDWIELYNTAATTTSLDGWYLTDDSLALTKWRIPDVGIAAGDYLVIFASGKDRSDPTAELHANFSLDAAGEYLALVRPDGTTVEQAFAPVYPPQKDDFSYGLTQTIASLVDSAHAASARVPADGSLGLTWTAAAFDDSAWAGGATPVGFNARTRAVAGALYVDVDAQGMTPGPLLSWPNAGLMSDLTTSSFPTNSPTVELVGGVQAVSFDGNDWMRTSDLAGADITGNDNWSVEAWVFNPALADEECFVNWGRRNDAPASGAAGSTAQINFGINPAYGAVTHWSTPDMGYDGGVPEAGVWTYIVVTYDGGAGGTERVYVNGVLNATEDKTLNIHGPGDGEAMPVLLGAATNDDGTTAAAKVKWFSGSIGQLRIHGGVLDAGDVLNNYLVDAGRYLAPLASDFGLDVQGAMFGQNAAVYLRLPFDAPDTVSYKSLELDVRYDDGFIAYVNGVEVARSNAPATPSWNSAATQTHDLSLWETINISDALATLTPAGNVLAIQGLNVSASDAGFLIDARLRAAAIDVAGAHYLYLPTPGGPNSATFDGFVEDTKFSVDRGFYDAPFSVDISTSTPGATILYTTDASWPSEGNGTTYTAPILIDRTTTLRAIATKSGLKATNADTHTYIFRDNILTQTRPAGYPTETYDPAHPLDYEVDQDVVGPASPFGTKYRDQFKDSLVELPTLSIVADVDDLFGPVNGIYSHSTREGAAWERGASFEWIDPITSKTTQANCALRIHGGYGRNAYESPKHSLRIVFKRDWGPPQLRFKLFPDTEVEEFDQLVARMITHDSWATIQPSINAALRRSATYAKDAWHRQTQRDMGHLSTYGRFCHVYLNGLYWGMYELVERPTAGFAAAHLGGSKDDYDALVGRTGQPYNGDLHDGDNVAWTAMNTIAGGGGPNGSLVNDAAYADLQQYLDVLNLADYFLLGFFSAISDWPGWNWYTARNRVVPGKFQYFSWDAEASLVRNSWPVSGTGRLNFNSFTSAQSGFNQGVGRLFNLLVQNGEFRMLLADRAYRHLLMPGGVLTSERNLARFNAVSARLQPGLVSELARWGDGAAENDPPYQLEPDGTYEYSTRYVEELFFPQRPAVVIGLFRTRTAGSVYPSIDPPVFNQQGGQVASGFAVTMTNPNAVGAIYYTDDGSDPRLPSTSGPTTTTEILALGADKRVWIPTTDTLGLTWTGGNEPFDDSGWTDGLPKNASNEGGVGFETGTGYESFISYDVEIPMDDAYTSCYIRIPFSVTAQDLVDATALRLDLRYDDGFVAYIDGVEVARAVAPASPAWNSNATAANENGSLLNNFDISPYLSSLTAGGHILAIHGMNDGLTSSDFLINPRMTITAGTGVNPAAVAPQAIAYNPGDPIPLQQSTRIKARVLNGAEWSALNEALFEVSPAAARTLIHYWNHNDTADLTTPSYTLGGGALSVALGAATEVRDDNGEGFAGLNARFGDPAGAHLRINNPLGAAVTFALPSTGYDSLVFKYETRRSGQGAGIQQVDYTVNGTNWLPLATLTILDADPVLREFDLSSLPATGDNPQLAVRISFAEGAGSTAGNHRFDNVTLEGVALPGVNSPPSLLAGLNFTTAVETLAPTTFDLNALFPDADGDALTFTADVDRAAFASAAIAGGMLSLEGLRRGESVVRLTAADATHPAIWASFRLLIQPAPFDLDSGVFQFGEWDPNQPELVYPPNMLFLQADSDDTTLATPLDYAYFIPADDYDAADTVGFPYNNANRTRINGLGADGISLINTGRNRDLGGALVALDTSGVTAAWVRWMGGTIVQNPRAYAIRLQYRVGATGPFSDLLYSGSPMEYTENVNGHTRSFGTIPLPAAVLDKPYVQLLWRYYKVGGDTGARTQLRLDEIYIGEGDALTGVTGNEWVLY